MNSSKILSTVTAAGNLISCNIISLVSDEGQGIKNSNVQKPCFACILCQRPPRVSSVKAA